MKKKDIKKVTKKEKECKHSYLFREYIRDDYVPTGFRTRGVNVYYCTKCLHEAYKRLGY